MFPFIFNSYSTHLTQTTVGGCHGSFGGGDTLSDGKPERSMDCRITSLSYLSTLRRYSSERPIPHVSHRHSNISSSPQFLDFIYINFLHFFRLELQREKHIEFLSKGLRHLGSAFSVLDARSLSLSLYYFVIIANSVIMIFLFWKREGKLKFVVVLRCSRPWLCYWIIHSIALLGESIDDELEDNTVDFLNRCQVSFIFISLVIV